ncbi:hypothetical protein [Nonomuraea sp. NPDC049028]|uniref:hypothetical protein n=1 Tax=Nonomuraea sp. NPDC049028 TaxID=3364348 RepID=UPI0037229EFD
MSRAVDPIAERFARETAQHEMTVLHDYGLYRHLRFRQPKQGAYWFDIITWPGCLAIRGDVDGGYIFTRVPDMFEFFRSKSGRINADYWAEKTQGGRDACKSYTEEHFKARVIEEIRYRDDRPAGLLLAIQNEIFRDNIAVEAEARESLERFKHEGFRFYDVWEWDLRDFHWHYLWCCHAIVWGISQYDSKRAELVAAGAVADHA